MAHIQTVLGPIAPEALGVTMMHEHLIWDQAVYLSQRADLKPEEAFLEQPVSTDNLQKSRYYYLHAHRDNVVQYDAEEAAEEVLHLRNAGGSSLVDCSCLGIARDPMVDLEVSRKTGVQIIMSTGVYIRGASPEADAMTQDEKKALFLKELTQGIGDTDIKAGVIAELGVSEAFPECEQVTLAAAGQAQAESGAAIGIHQPGLVKAGHDILDILEDNGADLHKVVLYHCDPLCDDILYLTKLLDRGVTLSFDQFGLECLIRIAGYKGLWLPRDIDRIRAIARLCELGYSRQLVLSQDLCFKTSYRKYGGGGYAHVLENMVPILRDEGVRETALHRMLVENPARILTIP